jgi:hypothetical protein
VVAPIAQINYTLSLATDPLTGPYTTAVNLTAGATIVIRLNQLTAGPTCNAAVSFGDGSANQSFFSLTAGSPLIISYNYTTWGKTFTISVNVTSVSLTNVNATVNTMTVNVAPLYAYSSNYIL